MSSVPSPVLGSPKVSPIPRIEPYHVDQRLGRGGYASVWLAWRRGPLGFHLPVALKILDASHQKNEGARRRFFAEARLLAALDHPNVVSIVDAGEYDGASYYAMEYVRGTTLAGLLRGMRSPLPVDGALYIGVRVGAALHAVHTATGPHGDPLEIVHRDVNPANILIGPRGTVKLIDFGIATSNLGPRDTRINVIKGSPAYLSPEQAFGGDIDPRADVYSLGLTIYEALTGVAPLDGGDTATIVARARQPRIPPPTRFRRSLDEQTERVLGCALQREPDDRFPDMMSFVRALHACLVGLNPGLLPESLDLLLERARPPELVPPVAATTRLPERGGSSSGAFRIAREALTGGTRDGDPERSAEDHEEPDENEPTREMS